MDECKEKLDKNVKIVKERGKIYFNVYWSQFAQVILFLFILKLMFLICKFISVE